MKLRPLLLSCALLLPLSLPMAQAQSPFLNQPQLDLPRATLQAGRQQISVQLAETPQQRQIGLMHRRQMPKHEGMLFVFEQPAVQCFWMRNTLIPLSAAFLDDEGRIVNIEDMKPQTEDSHCSKKPVRFVLEMNQGWFAKKGLSAGSRIGGEPFRPAGAALK